MPCGWRFCDCSGHEVAASTADIERERERGRIGSLLGENEAGASADEIAWAFRKLLEEQ